MALPSLIIVAAVLAAASQMMDAKTVIFIPPPMTSYMIYHTKVAGALASRGHDVWLCVPEYLAKQGIVKNKSVKVLQYGQYLGNVLAGLFKETSVLDKFWAGEDMFGFMALVPVGKAFVKIANEVLSDQSFVDTVRDLKPDLIVLESVPFNLNMVVLPYMLDVPYAFIGTVHDIVLSKVPLSPAAPIYPGNGFNDTPTFWSRVLSFIYYLVRINFDMFYDSSLVTKYAPNKPYQCINDLAAKAEIFIAELDHILDYPRPVLPNTKLVGGSSASTAKPLEGELQKFVNGSKNGIIVFTFGGNVLDIPADVTAKLMAAFKEIDTNVVWRANVSSPDSSHILTSKWLPQNDLLGHEKTKLFISHCGKNGQYEALYHAVPILCFPLYGDQGYNAERVKRKGLGLYADVRKVSTKELVSMIKELISNPIYKENMKKASSLYRELYKAPQNESAFWLDHVIQYGGGYMRSVGQKMPWYQILLLDVAAFIVTAIVFVLVIIYCLIRQCLRLCRGKCTKPKAKKE